MLAGEDLVHRLGPDGDDRPDLVAVDRLGGVRRTVACEAADLLDGISLSDSRETKVWRSSTGEVTTWLQEWLP